jgi:hypothetical protein
MRWDAANSAWSPYDDNLTIIPVAFRKGYWYLPQATNSVAYSRNLKGTGWSLHSAGTTPTLAQNATGFDGAPNTAWTMTTVNASSADSQAWGFAIGAQPTGTHLGAVRVRKEGASRVVTIRIRSADGSAASLLYLDVNTGTATVSAGVTLYGVVDDGDWWIPWVCVTTTNSASAVHLTLWGIDNRSATAQSTNTVFDQAEIRLNTSFYDGSPIVTNGSALTRLDGTYLLSYANHNQAAGMVLCEMETGIASNLITTVDNRILTNFNGVGPGQMYFTSASIYSYDSTSKISVSGINQGPGIINKMAVRWSGTSRSVIVNGVESAGLYDGTFPGPGADMNIYIAVNNPIPFYLKSLKYYTVDRGTAWIQGQQA